MVILAQGVCKPPSLLVREATHASCDTRIWIMYCVAACVGPTLMFSPDRIERQGRNEPRGVLYGNYIPKLFGCEKLVVRTKLAVDDRGTLQIRRRIINLLILLGLIFSLVVTWQLLNVQLWYYIWCTTQYHVTNMCGNSNKNFSAIPFQTRHQDFD